MAREFSVTPVISIEDNPNISLSFVRLKGINNRIIMPDSDAVYVCTKGIVSFLIGEDDRLSLFILKKGSPTKIDKGIPYLSFSEEGTTLIAVNKPAFDSKSIKILPISNEIRAMIAKINRDIKICTLLTSNQSSSKFSQV